MEQLTLTSEQNSVLLAYIQFVKRDIKVYIPPIKEAMVYDFKYGLGEALELLNKHFYQLIKIESLAKEEIKELAEIISAREYVSKHDDDYIRELKAKRINETPTNGKEFL